MAYVANILDQVTKTVQATVRKAVREHVGDLTDRLDAVEKRLKAVEDRLAAPEPKTAPARKAPAASRSGDSPGNK